MTYDTIVVGAGGAGAPLAARLSDDPARRVLLIEAGPDYPDPTDFPAGLKDYGNMQGSAPGHPNNWGFLGYLTPDLPYIIARGRIMGGSTSLNGTYFVRGVRADFDRYAALGNDEWSFEKVLPFYRELERDAAYGDDDVHSTKGPVPVQRAHYNAHEMTRAFYRACAELGYPEEADKNAQAEPGYGPIPLNVEEGVRMNTGFAFIDPVRSRPNLTIRPDTVVRRVVFDGTRATGVEVREGARTVVIEAREVVLSAGAIKSPHLLMLSGIGPREDLERVGIPVLADRPGVGRNVTDHPDIGVLYKARRGVGWTAHGDGIQAMLNLGATDSPFEGGDLEIIHTIKPFGVFALGARMTDPRSLRRLLDRPLETVKGLRGVSLKRLSQQIAHQNDFALLVAVQQPVGRGSITIESADPDTQPRVDYRYLEHEEDRRRMREVIRIAVRILQTQAYRSFVAEITELTPEVLDDDGRLDDWMREHLATAIHASSSCRMGPASDPDAVVDQYGRVYGVEGLRVADTSILPTVVSRGPSATAMMIGVRVAAFIADQRGAAPSVGAGRATA